VVGKGGKFIQAEFLALNGVGLVSVQGDSQGCFYFTGGGLARLDGKRGVGCFFPFQQSVPAAEAFVSSLRLRLGAAAANAEDKGKKIGDIPPSRELWGLADQKGVRHGV
jgi:hypothetical protein